MARTTKLQAAMIDCIIGALDLDDAFADDQNRTVWLAIDDLGLDYDHDTITEIHLRASLAAADERQLIEAYDYFEHQGMSFAPSTGPLFA